MITLDRAVIDNVRREKYPLIGVIGATKPNDSYDPELGVLVGHALRDYLGHTPRGTIFTGGVSGVGVDVYTGVMKYCVQQAFKDASVLPDDNFFILAPKYGSAEIDATENKRVKLQDYEAPSAYQALGRLSSRGHVGIVTAGDTMGDRREYLAHIADVLIVLNGGLGTLDEALLALQEQKPIIAFPYSGGAATLLKNIKSQTVPPETRIALARHQMQIPRSLDTSRIHLANDTQEMLCKISTLLGYR